MMSVVGQFVFNKFSQQKFPFDKWAVLDFFNALTNNFCFAMFLTISADEIMDRNKKDIYNWIQVIAVFVSWIRFLSFFLVMKSISLLIMTLAKMIIQAMPFFIMVIAYIQLMIPVFQILLQDDTVIYVNTIYTGRSLFDAMLGSYS